MKPLVIVGAGGFARETAAAVDAVNAARPTHDLLGFLDDDPSLVGRVLHGRRILGPVDLLGELGGAQVVVCTGHPGNYTTRRALVRRLDLADDRYATIIHPAAVIGSWTTIGPGSVILATAVATADVRVGSHVAIMPAVVLTHDDLVGDYATLGAGARLAGGVTIGEGAYVGSGATVREHRTIGAWSLVGMGAVVTHDVPPGEVWAGVPARRLRAATTPGDLDATGPARQEAAARGAAGAIGT